MLLDVQKDISFSLEIDTTLEFLNPVRPHLLELVDDVYAPTRDEVLEGIEAEKAQCVPEEGVIITLEYKTNDVDYWSVPEEGVIITLEYKTNDVDYWKSGKCKRLTLATVQKKSQSFNSPTTVYVNSKLHLL
ncbi:hypothetical protein QE152_g8902 [Popillia japonica]|uniref:Uncharacterized protein n=1 Tax=Popillia japonica TaxID=7064 RepID=A0AAW1M167_POPJA